MSSLPAHPLELIEYLRSYGLHTEQDRLRFMHHLCTMNHRDREEVQLAIGQMLSVTQELSEVPVRLRAENEQMRRELANNVIDELGDYSFVVREHISRELASYTAPLASMHQDLHQVVEENLLIQQNQQRIENLCLLILARLPPLPPPPALAIPALAPPPAPAPLASASSSDWASLIDPALVAFAAPLPDPSDDEDDDDDEDGEDGPNGFSP